MRLTGIGIWGGELRADGPGRIGEAAAELEQLRYTALWVPEGAGGPLFESADELLGATRRIPVATGILNVWLHDAADAAREWAAIDARHPGRFLLGLGISHPELFAGQDHNPYGRPVATMSAYLDGLVAEGPVPREQLLLAALGPRMIELAAARTLGVHPYLSPVAHTAWARELLGDAPLLAPEQPVVLERDPVRAREIARAHVSRYLDLPNFTRSLLRFGFEEADLHDGGSDRLVDAIVVQGDVDQIAARVREQQDAGADHVCLHVLAADPGAMPLAQWRELAALVG